MFAREIPNPFVAMKSFEPPRLWLSKLGKLRDVMLAIGASKIETVEALCREVVGDYIAGDVLNELLRLFPMAIREDGGVWQPDSYWKNRFAISRHRIEKCRKLLAPFIYSKAIKSGKAKTYHYWLRPDALIEGLSKVYGRSTTFIESIVYDCVDLSPDSQIEMPRITTNRNAGNRSKSITTLTTASFSLEKEDSQIQQQSQGNAAVVVDEKEIIQLPPNNFPKNANDNEIVELLVRNGVWREVARNYAEIPKHRVEAFIQYAVASRAEGNLRQSIPVYLAGCLKKYRANHEQEYLRAQAHGQIPEEIRNLKEYMLFKDLPTWTGERKTLEEILDWVDIMEDDLPPPPVAEKAPIDPNADPWELNPEPLYEF